MSVADALDRVVAGMLALQDEGRFDEPNLDGTPGDYISFTSWEWPQGVGLYALATLFREGGRDDLGDTLGQWFDRHLSAGLPSRNINTTAPMLALAMLWEARPEPRYRAALDDWADWVMTGATRTGEGGLQHDVSDKINPGELWADTLVMVGLFLARYGFAAGRADLVAEAERQFLVHTRALTDPSTGLWFHGFTFEGRHNFAQARWARGNAWASLAITDLCENPAIAGSIKTDLRSVLTTQISALLPLQTKTGAFRTLLDEPDAYEELSATAGFAYALMKGARIGLGPPAWQAAGRRALAAVLADLDGAGVLQSVSYGTRMGQTLEFYKEIPLQPTAYGQALAALALVEAARHA
ncbi:MAG: glycoside hydrolase family 88 protein [Pseudomonadota bacterium]